MITHRQRPALRALALVGSLAVALALGGPMGGGRLPVSAAGSGDIAGTSTTTDGVRVSSPSGDTVLGAIRNLFDDETF